MKRIAAVLAGSLFLFATNGSLLESPLHAQEEGHDHHRKHALDEEPEAQLEPTSDGQDPDMPDHGRIQTALDSPAMKRARAELIRHSGGQRFLFLQADRLELQSGDEDGTLLDGQGWYGGDLDRLWFKVEAERPSGGSHDGSDFEEFEVQALFSRAISPYFDLQFGARHDFEPSSRSFGVVGVQGLAAYWFEIDAALFLSSDGDLSGRIESGYELLMTQRLILQPRVELDLTASDVPEARIASGLVSVEAGLRLRYEWKREFAPYLGVEWVRVLGRTADLLRVASEDPQSSRFVVGLRLWR